jgi:o-succinylbenzoate---CoA ligase
MVDLVALDLAPGDPFVDALRRCWDRGEAILPVDPRLPGPARQRLLDTLRPSSIISQSGRRSLPNGVPALDGDAIVIATSGTTGLPKGVILTHDAVAASAHATSQRLSIDPTRDKWLACLPVAHIGGLSVITRALLTNTPMTVLNGFDLETVNAATDSGHTRVSLVVAAFRRIDPRRWKTILLGGSAMPAALAPNVVKTYGMTETGSGVVYDGTALDGVEIETRNDELYVRGPMLLRAYRSASDNHQLTPEGIDPRTDGWFRTGDAGSIDADGRVRVVGRIGDVIVTGGEKVWPDAVERVLSTHPQVREVAITSRPDEQWGQRVVAVIVPTDFANPPTLDTLRAHTKTELPAYAAPQEIIVRAELPKTASGKVQRTQLFN